jgi:hypothetical protein
MPDASPQPDRAPDRGIDMSPSPDLAPDTAPQAGASCPATDDALMLCLRFENTMVDESQPPATVTSGNVAYEDGLADTALRMDALSELHAEPGWGDNLDLEFTLEAWIRPERLPVDMQRFGVFDEESHFGLFLLPNGAIRCSSSGAVVLAPNAAMAGQWTAVSCTASANTLTLYINGVDRGQAQMDGNANGVPTTLVIGGNHPSGDLFEGLIDNMRVWSRARTPAEVCAYAPGCPAP